MTIAVQNAKAGRFQFLRMIVPLFQGLGAAIAFVFGMIFADLLVPLSPQIMAAAASASGFLSTPLALLFSAAVNALVLVWAARRSSFKGWRLFGQLLVLSFGPQVFLTQIETGYFISAFPLLHNNFQVYVLVLRGFISSLVPCLLVTWMCGGFSKQPRPQSVFTVTADRGIRQGAWLAAAYVALYMLFGYFVAWQVRELRLFYGGPAELNGLFNQWGLTLMARPEFPVFQYFRGVLWLLCLVPLFRGFTARHAELVVLCAVALALLPTAQLAFPNPLMPAAVSLGHFWEVSISTGIFGALCAWFVPQAVSKTS
jgi:hypothetical protein